MGRTQRSRTYPSLGATAAAAAVAVTVVLAACGDSTAPLPAGLSDAEIAADVAALTGQAIAADVASFHDDATIAGVASISRLSEPGGAVRASVAAAAAAAAGCTYDAVSQTHVCSATTENGLEVTRTYQFRDAADAPMQNYDAANTASIHFTRTATGSVTVTTASGATWTGVTHRADDRTVTGLLGDETQRVWNGTGESHDTTDYTSANSTRHYAGGATQTARDVVTTLPHASFPYPASGTITRDVSFTVTTTGQAGNFTKAVSRTVTVTFNGTALVPIQVGDVTCTLNLSTGRSSGCSRQAA